MAFEISRKHLYDLVWSKPLRNLASEVGISDVALAKHCRAADIPLPGVGYWNKKSANKPVAQPELPPADIATRSIIQIMGTWPESANHLPTSSDEPFEILFDRFKERIHGNIPKASLKPAHSGIRRRLERDEKAKLERARFGYAWLKPVYDDPLQRRKLTLMNGLHLAAMAAGGSCQIRAAEDDLMYLSIGHLRAQCRVEVAGRSRRGDEQKSPPSLRLWVDSYNLPVNNVPTSWIDKPGAPLERRMEEVLLGIVVVAARIRDILDERHREDEKRRKKDLARLAEEQLGALERSQRQKLLDEEQVKKNALIEDTKNWRLAADMRDFIAAAESNLQIGIDSEWFRWAHNEADRIDPLKRTECVAVKR